MVEKISFSIHLLQSFVFIGQPESLYWPAFQRIR